MSKRFTVQGELNRIDEGLRSESQHEWGVFIKWYRYNAEATDPHDIYDVGTPRRWRPGVLVPVIFALPTEPEDTFHDEGLYTNRRINFALTMAKFRDHLYLRGDRGFETRAGMVTFLRDRIEYDGSFFTIDQLAPTGELQGRDVVLAGRGREIHPGDMFIDEETSEEV